MPEKRAEVEAAISIRSDVAQQTAAGKQKLAYRIVLITSVFIPASGSAAGVYICLPGQKLRGGYRMALTLFGDMDVAAYAGRNARIRVRRSADVLQGDLLVDQTTSRSFFVTEIIFEQSTKICVTRELTSRIITRKRAATADLNLDVTWVEPASAGFDGNMQEETRAQIGVKRSADVVAGDILSEAATGEQWFVYELLFFEQIKICLCLNLSNQIVVRQRAAVTDLTLDAAWVSRESAGFEADLVEGIRARVKVRRSADVLKGDYLLEQASGEKFFVYELLRGQVLTEALCMEVLTRTRYGVADANITPAWLIVHSTGVRKVIVYCRIPTLSNAMLTGQRIWMYLGARLDSTHGVYAVKAGKSGGGYLTRIDQAGAVQDGETAEQMATGTYLRLARVGNVFTAYGSNVTSSAGPQSEADWTVLGSTGDVVSGGQ